MIRFPITKELLEQNGACECGAREFEDMLPLDISTNAWDNYSLAVQLIKLNLSYRIWWLLDKVLSERDEFNFSKSQYWWDVENFHTNPQQLATLLAFAALDLTNEVL